ncbi:MAG: two-component system, OmpR family, response regulator, partial [Thermoleophilaceae bacterium]|nr:two-component system, OmpR family, response regulator [Thermoleophilaceae bacterium]
MRVLVVEDEPRMASVIRRSLAKAGLAADVTGRGDEGVWMAGAVEYDAIVLDVMLPDTSGFEVCRK